MDVWYPPLFETSSLEYQAKLILGRVENTEAKFGRFCKDFAYYSRYVASLRDIGDGITANLAKFYETQENAPTTRSKIREFTGLFLAVQDQEHAKVLRLQSKVVAGFSKYGVMCNTIKEEIKESLDIREREHQQAEEFSKLQAKFVGNFHLRQQRQTELNTAISDTRRAQEFLKYESDKFEQQKIRDTRQILMNFCEIELAYHARVLEIFTAAYNVVRDVGPDADMEHFRKTITGQFDANVKVGLDHVPVHVPSDPQVVEATTFRTSEAEVIKPHGQSIVKPASLSTEGHGTDTDTKEFAVTTTEGEDELVSEVAYHFTPTDDEGDVSTDRQRPPPAATKKMSKKLKVTIADVMSVSKDGKRRESRTSKTVTTTNVNQPLTDAQIRRYSRHFGVHPGEYTTDSEHGIGGHSLGNKSAPS